MTARLYVCIAATAVLGANACAAPITFTYSGVGSGQLVDPLFVTWTNAPFTITATADTANRDQLGGTFPTYWIDNDSVFIDISGVGIHQIITPTRFFVNTSASVVGFSRAGATGLDLTSGPAAPQLHTWDMTTSIGPITSESSFNWGPPNLALSNGFIDFQDLGLFTATFTAVVVPEPASLALALVGLVAVGIYGCRRRRCRVMA